ncbi:MAG: polar amino acid ABC transporter permease [Leifsonia xyli]|nr:MAG: polar amino acid ABC transporter permease [Leifsonia xyli]
MTNVLYDVPGPRARRRSRIISIVGVLVIVVGLAALVWALAAPRVTASGTELPGMFDPSRWDILNDRAVWRRIGVGLVNTLQMAGVAAVGAVVFGVLISFLRTARSRWIRSPMVVVLEFLRGMPVLLMMLFVLLIFSTGAYWAGVTALVLYNGAIIGEALRAGIAALPRGQREAGLALGLGPVRTRLAIEFPQAFRQMLPIVIAQLVVLLKDTSLAYVIGYNELLRTTTNQLANYYGSRYLFTLFFVTFAIYLTMNLLLSWLARIVARRVDAGRLPRGSTPFSRRAERRASRADRLDPRVEPHHRERGR